MHVVEGISDRVVALDHGVKIAEGDVRAGGDRPAGRRGVSRHVGDGDEVSDGNGSQAKPLLELDAVDTYYGQIHILQGLEPAGAARASSCACSAATPPGKSTTLKTILGIVQPRNGSVRFAGEDVTKRPTSYRIRKGMAIVPENRRLFAPMTVLENLQMGAYLHGGGSKEDFERVYTLFPLLHERRAQLAGTLSGGEQQMVAMGRALMAKPKLLLMDEPSMGLAPILVERSFEIIQQVHRVRRGDADRRAERERLALDRRPRATSSRPAGSCSRARPPTCARTRTSARPTSAARRPAEVCDFRRGAVRVAAQRGRAGHA